MAGREEVRSMEMKDYAKNVSGINVIAGAWLIIAPFILGYAESVARTNDIWTGAAVGILSFIKLFMPEKTMWIGWITIVLGLWLILAPFVLSYTGIVPIWNDIILGIIVTGISLWSMSTGAAPRHRVSV